MPVALRASVVIALILAWPRLTTAQDLAAAVEARLDVHREPNGGLFMAASNARLDDVIRAVAEAANIPVISMGAAPHNRVTVSFSDGAPEMILRDLMDPAGVSYVLVAGGPGGPGRLVMGLLSASVHSGPAVVPATASTVTSSPFGADPVDVTTNATADEPPAQEEPSRRGATEWPADVPPVNYGPVVLPDSLDAAFQMVNGSAPVSLPSSVTPNQSGARSVGMPSTNGRPRAPFAVGETAARPGAVSSLGAATPFPSKPPPVDASMLRPPLAIQVPSPVIVQFPATRW